MISLKVGVGWREIFIQVVAGMEESGLMVRADEWALEWALEEECR